jgi:GTP-binding protein HflX
VVTKTLSEIGAAHVPTVLVLNKVDLFKKEYEDANLEEMKGYYSQHGFEKIVFVSATARENIDVLRSVIFEEVKKKHLTIFPNFLKDGYDFSAWQNDSVES